MDHQIEEYDIIVIASNGVWDNMFKEDIIKCIEENMPSGSKDSFNKMFLY